MLSHAVRAAIFDRSVFNEIGDDPESMFRALGVVAMAAIAFSVGLVTGLGRDTDGVPMSFILVAISTVLLSWIAWAYICYFIGSVLLGGQASQRMLLRALGIAYGPGVVMALIGIPRAGNIFVVISIFWLLVAAAIAVRETQSHSWAKVLASVAPSGILALLFLPYLLFRFATVG